MCINIALPLKRWWQWLRLWSWWWLDDHRRVRGLVCAYIAHQCPISRRGLEGSPGKLIVHRSNSTSTCFFFCVQNQIQIQFYIYMFHLISAHYCSQIQTQIHTVPILQTSKCFTLWVPTITHKYKKKYKYKHTFPILHLHVFLSVYTLLKQPLHRCIFAKKQKIFNTNTQR